MPIQPFQMSSHTDINKCLAIVGTGIEVADCTGQSDQIWFKRGGLVSQADQLKCIDAGDGAVGQKLVLQDCKSWSQSQNVANFPVDTFKWRGLCLEVTSTGTQLESCNDQDSQKWYTVADHRPVVSQPTRIMPNLNNGKCLGLDGSGTSLEISKCNGGASQAWIFREFSFGIASQADETKCIDGGAMVVGQELSIGDCNANQRQQQQMFDFDLTGFLTLQAYPGLYIEYVPSDGGDTAQVRERSGVHIGSWQHAPVTDPAPSIRSTASPSLCVDLPGADTSNGAELWMWRCLYGEDNQQWAFQDGQLVYLADTSKCVDMLGGDSTNGNVLGLWDCYQGDSQLWGFDSDTGTIYLASSAESDATKCIQTGGSLKDPVVIWDCNGDPSQVWELFGSSAHLSSQPTRASQSLQVVI